jgi:restriction system protein
MPWFNSRKSTSPAEAQTSLDGIRSMAWPAFETLVVEAFRQRGYQVEVTGHGGLDGDVDLILRKDGRTELVQCKQWKTRQVHVATVQELWGLVKHHKADAMKIVSAGTFSADAGKFAHGKAIELIDGEHLLELVRDVDVPQPTRSDAATPAPAATANATAPVCPRCGSAMFKRFNRATNQMYWGCTNYPGCKGAKPL